MATSEMLQELIRAHVSGDVDRFRQIALQVAAREARVGHRVVAGNVALFDLPGEEAREHLLGLLTASHGLPEASRRVLAREAEGLSHAEITRAVTDAVKAVVLSDRRRLRKADVSLTLAEMVDRRTRS